MGSGSFKHRKCKLICHSIGQFELNSKIADLNENKIVEDNQDMMGISI